MDPSSQYPNKTEWPTLGSGGSQYPHQGIANINTNIRAGNRYQNRKQNQNNTTGVRKPSAPTQDRKQNQNQNPNQSRGRNQSRNQYQSQGQGQGQNQNQSKTYIQQKAFFESILLHFAEEIELRMKEEIEIGKEGSASMVYRNIQAENVLKDRDIHNHQSNSLIKELCSYVHPNSQSKAISEETDLSLVPKWYPAALSVRGSPEENICIAAIVVPLPKTKFYVVLFYVVEYQVTLFVDKWKAFCIFHLHHDIVSKYFGRFERFFAIDVSQRNILRLLVASNDGVFPKIFADIDDRQQVTIGSTADYEKLILNEEGLALT
jgi:hypothetical protein